MAKQRERERERDRDRDRGRGRETEKETETERKRERERWGGSCYFTDTEIRVVRLSHPPIGTVFPDFSVTTTADE